MIKLFSVKSIVNFQRFAPEIDRTFFVRVKGYNQGLTVGLISILKVLAYGRYVKDCLQCQEYPRQANLTAFLTSAFVFWKTLLYVTMFIAPPQGFVL